MTAARVLVTGAGGFAGGAIASGLAALGWQVTAVDRAFDGPAQAALAQTGRARAHIVTADLAACLPPLPQADVIIHAAALTTDPTEMGMTAADHIAANMRPLLAVMAHAAVQPPAAFVFLSSSGVFAPGDGALSDGAPGDGAPCDGARGDGAPGLTDDCAPTGTAPYAAAKRAGEVLALSALAGVCAVHVLRLGYLYGPAEAARATRQRVSALAAMIAAARAGRPVGVAADDPRRDWTLTTDLAPALARLLAAPAAGRVLHFGSPHIRRDSAMAALVARAVPGTRIVTVPGTRMVTVPGTQMVTVPGTGHKPPMIASRIPALDGFGWTAPETAIPALLAAEVPA